MLCWLGQSCADIHPAVWLRVSAALNCECREVGRQAVEVGCGAQGVVDQVELLQVPLHESRTRLPVSTLQPSMLPAAPVTHFSSLTYVSCGQPTQTCCHGLMKRAEVTLPASSFHSSMYM